MLLACHIKSRKKNNMKTKILATLLLLMLALGTLFGCDGNATPPEGDGTGDGGGQDYSSYVWGGDIIPAMIIDRSVRETNVNKIYMALSKTTLNSPDYYYADDPEIIPEGAHEIVIGNNTGRSITRKAVRKLREVQRVTDGDVAYVIYASRGSVAIVAEDDVDGLGMSKAVESFIEDFVTDRELKLTSGVVTSGTVDPMSFYAESDKLYYEAKWAQLEAAVGGENGKAIVAAMKELYSIYNHDVVTWFANLYDPGVGGFYYSNSARDNGSYAPDTESTGQALGFIGGLGTVRAWRTGEASGYPQTFSEKRKSEILIYIKSLQDPNGFFYNYQWDKAATDAKASRRARDLSNCVGILSALGAKPTYTTPTGVKGDGIVVEGTYDPTILMQGPTQIGTSTARAVSKVILAATYAPQFEDLESLNKYLADFEASTTSFYSIGNTMTAQMAQVIARDKTLRREFESDPANAGKTYVSLAETIVKWFNKHQDPENGLWGHNAKATANYGGVNGLLKISGVYNSAGAEIPYAEKAAKSAIDAITSDEPMGAVVDLYNTWFSVGNILSNLKTYGSAIYENGEMVTGVERAERIVKSLREIAAPAIVKSGEKISAFMKEDGSFSYTKNSSSSTSQGMPVAVVGTNEGDVNATVISTNGIKNHICEALGIPNVALYGEVDLRVFLEIFENLDPVIKHTPLIPLDDEPITFDDCEIDDTVTDVNVTMLGGGQTVIKDPREGAEGNVIRVTGYAGSGGYIYSKNNAPDKRANCAIFEMDMCVNSATTKSYIFQISLGQSYMIDIVVEGDEVIIREATTTSWGTARYTNAAKVPLGSWFKVRVEFYKNGYYDDPRALIYVNDELKIVSDGFFGLKKGAGGVYSGIPNKGAVTQTALYKMMGVNIDVLIDNIYTTSVNKSYQVVEDPEGKLSYNVDKGKPPIENPEA